MIVKFLTPIKPIDVLYLGNVISEKNIRAPFKLPIDIGANFVAFKNT